MFTSSLSTLLSQATPKELAEFCRDAEEPILRELRGDIFALQVAYRYSGLFLRARRRFPMFAELPSGLQAPLMEMHRRPKRAWREAIGGAQYAMMRERMEQAVKSRLLALKYPSRVVFEDDPALERARRIEIYTKQVERLDAILGDKRQRLGPKPKPVHCVELNRPFPSARAAAKYLREEMGLRTFGADVRTAIKRGSKCRAFTFIPASKVKAKPQPTEKPMQPTTQPATQYSPSFPCPYFVTHTMLSPDGRKRCIDHYALYGADSLDAVLVRFKQIKAMFPDALLIDLNASTLAAPSLSDAQREFLKQPAAAAAPELVRARGQKTKPMPKANPTPEPTPAVVRTHRAKKRELGQPLFELLAA